jgi:hypothetical protein
MAFTVKLVPIIEEPKTHRGIPVLTLHVDDPLPNHRAPIRYAVHVGPDLARYLLTFNPSNNRQERPRKIRAMATDMVAGRWQFSPQCPYFGVSGLLINGQNTLRAVIEAGVMIWLVLDFGWQDELINVLDRGTAKTTADALKHEGVPNHAGLAAIVSTVWKYDRLVGSSRSMEGYDVPTTPETLDLVASDLEAWQASARAGKRIYERLDHGASPSTWGAVHHIVGRLNKELADAFFDEIAEGSGVPRSATRDLADWFRRRPNSMTKTGDSREPIEVMVRAFNAWKLSRRWAFPQQKGFPLSRVRI